MPTYEYVCSKCDHRFEVVQSIMLPALTTCPKDQCGQKKWGKGKVKRAISSGAGLIFKGSGFYITDYRSENYKESAKKDALAAPTSGAGTKTAAEGKPAPAKTESKAESKPAKSGN